VTRFDDSASIYRAQACCQLLHYRWAAVLVAVVEAMVSLKRMSNE